MKIQINIDINDDGRNGPFVASIACPGFEPPLAASGSTCKEAFETLLQAVVEYSAESKTNAIMLLFAQQNNKPNSMINTYSMVEGSGSFDDTAHVQRAAQRRAQAEADLIGRGVRGTEGMIGPPGAKFPEISDADE